MHIAQLDMQNLRRNVSGMRSRQLMRLSFCGLHITNLNSQVGAWQSLDTREKCRTGAGLKGIHFKGMACLPAIHCLIHDKQHQIQVLQHSLLLHSIPASGHIWWVRGKL